MKFWLSLVSVMEVDQLVEIARFAEEVGFHGITMADHLVMPARIESKYPYTEDGAVFWPQDTPWPDPWITLTAMGMVTKKLKLMSNIYLAALRDPFTAAKAISTASVLTGGRVACGLSAGWIKEEYDLVHVDFASRGRRLDELIAAMRKLWTGKVVSHKGEFFDFEAMMCPPPPAPIPVWCGGGSKPAIRRAAMNDGWLPLAMTLAQMQEAAADVRAIRGKGGLSQSGFTICYVPAEPLTQTLVDGLKRLDIDDTVAIGPWLSTPWDIQKWTDEGDDIRRLEVKKKAIGRFAETVLAKFGR
ncbi:MAG TPA: TIGR03619 family F420-dependent LLM class oxidoreductase [Alphaproteobacteria bacterium]|nr:TIGR03619 family F420-dependent LLM class oxidoreductase [Alphaproteobacteria bacterium]